MNKKTALFGGIAAVVLIAAVGLWYFVLRDDAPDEVSTEAGLEQLQEDLANEDATTTTTEAVDDAGDEGGDTEPEDTTTTTEAPAPAGPVDGVWNIDDDFGDFGFDNPSGSFAGFRLEETFPTGTVDAVGRTGGVTGSITITDNALAAADISVDLTVMESDLAARADVIKDAINADANPTGTFVATSTPALDTEALAAGTTVTADVDGDLTVNGVTQPVTITIEATIAEEGIALVIGSAPLVWADFDVDTPDTPLAEVADNGILEFQLVVRLA